jgi:putative Mg2+ transporter-C (MgtC) family protein
METFEIVLRLFITFVLAMVFGLERQRSHKPISFGTFIFVALGSCGLAIGAINLNVENPLPLLSGIVTGIGFLGAGAMIKTSDKIFGFTTAASIWIFAIVGLLFGIGDYLLGSLIYLGIWIVIFIDRFLEDRGIGSYQKKLIIKTKAIISEKDLKKVLLLHLTKYKLISVEIDKTHSTMTNTYLIESGKTELNKIPDLLYEHEWFESCKIE